MTRADPAPATRSALVLTVERPGRRRSPRWTPRASSWPRRLAALGFAVERAGRAGRDRAAIEAALIDGAATHPLVVTTGGTGLTPRDVTPQATAAILDYEVPGIAEAMRADGRRSTPFAALSRGLVGVRGRHADRQPARAHPRARLESLEVVIPLLDHALETLAGPFDHLAARRAGRDDLPPDVSL